jgi:prepilin-type N-terminal cleavage/methylation domain-containing protein
MKQVKMRMALDSPCSCSKPFSLFKIRHQGQIDQIKGFSLVEVLVAMMVSCIFVAITMQAIVAAAFFRARAEQFDEGVNWIQEDLESVIKRAGQYETDIFPRAYSSRCNPATNAEGLPAGFMNDTATGLGGAQVTVGTKSFGGKSFELRRSADYQSSSDPKLLLKISYQVVPEGGGKAIATTTTEVLPYAVLRCP